ncbi:nucleoside hydrolase [Rhizobium sp. L1K21]|uniref:nucleoside hydrolase n=1 Tax=Rhizobium sp. L1K21 TaxID=2954933 RepID=UPI002093E12D|nr:nucleoside hydrolase [Rhizobium sp. L1K21]MCO6185797.1 nucleoside hydrolase [Rhizobium sp. L1K21]
MQKVIYDTDPGVDDAMALLFLENHPDIDLVGITTVFGNAYIEETTNNALFLKREWNIAAPVAKGAGQHFEPNRVSHIPPRAIHGPTGLGPIINPDVTGLETDPRDAPQFIIDTVRAHPHEIVIVAVGRMTNLANALSRDPGIASLVKQVVVMGGAFDHRGNVTPAAEANIHGDPEAADKAFTAPWPVVLIGLNITHQTSMTRAELASIAEATGARGKLLNDLSQEYFDFYDRIGDDSFEGMIVHDSCAAVYAAAPELFETRSGPVRVVCGGIADGQTIQMDERIGFGMADDWRPFPSQKVVTGIDAPAVLKVLRETLLLVKS